jgi:hypothetical protein
MLTKEQRKERLKRKLARKQQRIAELRARWAKSGPDDLLDEVGACLYVGGARPIDSSTLWRNYSPPIKVGPQARRWPRRNLERRHRAYERGS